MRVSHCQHCGYDLTGLSGGGVCPECGKRYDTLALDQNAFTQEPLWVSYLPTFAMGVVTLAILSCGGLLSLLMRKPLAGIATTLVIAAVTGFMGFVYGWSAHKERRGE